MRLSEKVLIDDQCFDYFSYPNDKEFNDLNFENN